MLVSSWSIADISSWLSSHCFEQFIGSFEEQRIDGCALLALTESDLNNPLLCSDPCVRLGDIKRLQCAIAELRMSETGSLCPKQPGLPSSPSSSSLRELFATSPVPLRPSPPLSRSLSPVVLSNNCSPLIYLPPPAFCSFDYNKSASWTKLLLSILYMYFSVFLQASVVVFSNNRIVSINSSHPPLPDVFLDSIPLLPCTFLLSEFVILALALTNILIVLFHKYRFAVLRRYMNLWGTVSCIRAFCMVFTAIPIPDSKFECRKIGDGTVLGVFWEAWQIVSGMGLSISGIRTCGDYMFSGHTSILMLLTLNFTEYVPQDWKVLHRFVILLDTLGIFCVLASHEHYVIDVIVAVIVVLGVWSSYHQFAIYDPLFRPLHHRPSLALLCPLAAFFEADNAPIPNEVEPFWITAAPFCSDCLFAVHSFCKVLSEHLVNACKTLSNRRNSVNSQAGRNPTLSSSPITSPSLSLLTTARENKVTQTSSACEDSAPFSPWHAFVTVSSVLLLPVGCLCFLSFLHALLYAIAVCLLRVFVLSP